ncbi:aldehyde dehydrogenase [Mycobacterium sp. 48b]|uniref:aldehyde dehydrogenase n=1 Tax=Mycobacterium sp. 48b TaxID=3400426 RepID=UPI003AAB28D8
MQTLQDKLFIAGKWTAPSTPNSISVISPHTGAPIASVAAAGPADVDSAVNAARAAFDNGPWPRLTPQERIEAIQRVAGLYKDRRAEMAEQITAEIGAPITFSKRAQVQLPLMLMAAFNNVASTYPWHESRPGFYGGDISITRHPVGVVAAVVPWNMPQFLTVGKIIPALLAGCTVIVKPAPESPLDARLLAEIIEAADLPAGVVSFLPGDSEVGARLVGHPGVDKVSFTGSTDAGRHVAQACASHLTPASLELGGKSAALILDDADPTTTAKAIVQASLANSGQVCNALTRILVPAEREAEYVEAFVTEMDSLVVGDPADAATQIGPLVSARQQARVRHYIDEGTREGARLVTGGPDMPANLTHGWYVRPTLFSQAHNQMRIAREEIFGPVLTVIGYRDEDEGVDIANDSDYGLAGAVFTTDIDHARSVASRVRSGSFGINQGYIMDPLAPFGGVKASGYGRELGPEGLAGYLYSQSTSVARPSQ